MKNRKVLLKILMSMILITLFFGVNTQVKAQQGVIPYLEERLYLQKIPLVSIKITQNFPLQIEVTLQSTSDGITGVSEDPIYLQTLEREIIFARQNGYFIDRFTRITLSKNGEQISWSDTHVKIFENIFIDTSPSKVSNEITTNEIASSLNLYGMSASNINIYSENGVQFLLLELTTSIEEANLVIANFMKSLRPSIDRTNIKGSHIVVCTAPRNLDSRAKQDRLLCKAKRSATWQGQEGHSTPNSRQK